jgi:hypothetical protein
MKTFKVLIAVAMVATSAVGFSAVGDFGAAYAKGHTKKGKPGKCGTTFFYSKKERACVNAALK